VGRPQPRDTVRSSLKMKTGTRALEPRGGS
jgi:hypothetical protein